jgi:nucleoside-diphosphate-sugar epimerase
MHPSGQRIFIAGASGVIGRRLVPRLVAAGHEVVGTTRRTERADLLRGLGARPVVVDALDRDALIAAVREARPDVIIHQMTDLSRMDLAANARLRIEGTRNLVDAARAAGVRRLIAQSIAFVYVDGNHPASEDEPLDLDAPEPRRTTVLGVQALEDVVGELEVGVVLRYGSLYGPGTMYAPDGSFAERVRRGEVAANDSVTSFCHVDDAAAAALQALDWPAGIVNICDDEPAPARDWLPRYAARIGAPPPPVARGRDRGARGASNAKAHRELDWQPLRPSWRDEFVALFEYDHET